MSQEGHNKLPLEPAALHAYNASRTLEDTAVACHAPFNSIYFMPEGQIVPCCYNRTHLYGKYPETTVEEAWFGQNALDFREKIISRKFDVGCARCLDQINAGNHEGVHARIYDRPLAFKQPSNQLSAGLVSQSRVFPEILEFELNNICNLECVMCGGMHSHLIRRNREKLPPLQSPYDNKFVEQLEPFIQSAKVARFLGGEPFLIPIYYDIWERFINVNPDAELHITTNATVLNDRVWRVLDRCRVHPVISVDSMDPENYESIRKNASFSTFISNVESLQEFCEKKGIPLTFSCCPIQQNWEHLHGVLEYCNENNVRLYFNTVVMPESASLRFLSKDDLQKVIDRLDSVEPPGLFRNLFSKSRTSRDNNLAFQNMITQLRAWHKSKKEVQKSEEDQWVTHLLNVQGTDIEDKPLEFKLEIFDRLKRSLTNEQVLVLCKHLFLNKTVLEDKPLQFRIEIFNRLKRDFTNEQVLVLCKHLFLNKTAIEDKLEIFDSLKYDFTNEQVLVLCKHLFLSKTALEDKPLQFKLEIFDRLRRDLTNEQVLILCKHLFLNKTALEDKLEIFDRLKRDLTIEQVLILCELLFLNKTALEDKPLQFKLEIFDRLKRDLNDEHILVLCRLLFVNETATRDDWSVKHWFEWLLQNYSWEHEVKQKIQNTGMNTTDELYRSLLRTPANILQYTKVDA